LVLDEEIEQKEYRGKFEIIKDILQVISNARNPGSKKTHIMYGANLSFKLLERYVAEVLQAGLVCYDGVCFYAITNKGKEFLKIYDEYEREQKEFEKYFATLNNGKEELRKMLE
jgi:predicted transcriptional regulator